MTVTPLFSSPCTFIAGAPDPTALPEPRWPEVAFAGRSNVGKSSLINALTGRKTLARTSQTPGRTQQINFFLLGEQLMLVDLPGYGYAKAAKKQVNAWNETTRAYLRGRAVLRRVCLLLDARREPTKDDLDWMEMLDEAAVSYQLVLTKCDKLPAAALSEKITHIQAIAAKHPAAMKDIIASSAEKKTGIEDLRERLAALAE